MTKSQNLAMEGPGLEIINCSSDLNSRIIISREVNKISESMHGGANAGNHKWLIRS